MAVALVLLLGACDGSQSITGRDIVLVRTEELPHALVGAPYRQELQAVRGNGRYLWRLASGRLPSGLTLGPDGTISGAPTTVGGSDFTVEVQSAESQATRRLSIPVYASHLLIAFIGDQGYESPGDGPFTGPRAVLALIRDEGADLVLHQGDFDYFDSPMHWIRQIDDVLGPDFPYLASVGNHDAARWHGPDGYQGRLEARARRHGISWTGKLGEASSLSYGGVRIIFGSPGINPAFDSQYLTRELVRAPESWRICSWHMNQGDMQVGDLGDHTGWEPYEACRRGGAIIATGHNHVYARTHLLSHIPTKRIAGTGDTLSLTFGRTFVFVSGLGGHPAHPQTRDGPWWASAYTASQGAAYGALFAEFFDTGGSGLARFYFKTIHGETVDEFWVRAATKALLHR